MQFSLVLDFLLRGRPMIDFDKFFNLLDFLKFELPKYHWDQNSAWDIARSLTHVVNRKMKGDIQEAPFFSVSADEVTTIANEAWISMHIYIVQRFKRVPLLLTSGRVAEACTALNLSRIVVESLMIEDGLTRDQIGDRMVSFGSDDASVFTGQKGGVTKILADNIAPYLVGHHCVTYCVQLAAQKILVFPLVERV
jgi:hypothetical protein